ncbi:MAG: hypothetical protein P8Z79_14365 [Sedimentisphaerales bacterium]
MEKSENKMFYQNNPKLLLTLIVFIFLAGPIGAEVPGSMNYQGYLTNDAGNPVADSLYNVTFKIYDETNTKLWEESHQIATSGGLFSVQLGSNGSPLNADVFNHSECWLGITVGTDPEISPRTQLNTVPYSFKAGNVQSEDIINEPGVAAYSGAFYVYLNDLDYTTLCSLTINCPAEGFVMAVAHGRIATLPQHTMGTKSYAVVGISDTPNSLPGNQDLDFQIDSAAPSGTYSIPFGMTSMFTVPAAGSYTYYYLAYEYSGSVSVADMQFNLIYFPTAYGAVDPVPPPVRLTDGDGSNLLHSQTNATAENRQAKPEAVDAAQLKLELATLKTKIETIQQQIDSISIQK